MWDSPPLSPVFPAGVRADASFGIRRAVVVLGLAVCLLPLMAAAGSDLHAPLTDGDAPAKRRFTVVASDYPRFMVPEERIKLEVVVRNDGDLAWGADRQVRLSYRWRGRGDKRWTRGIRTGLPGVVEPGATAELVATVVGPKSAGLFDFRWDLVEEQVGWFSKTDPTPAPVRTVIVLPFAVRSSGFLPPVPFFLWLGAVTLVSVVAFKRQRSGRALPPFVPPETDVYWLVAALFLKQNWVLVSAGWPPVMKGVWVSLATSVLIAVVIVAFPQRRRPWVTWGLNLFFSALLCADLVYIRFFEDLPSFALVGASGQTWQVMESVISLLEWTDLWFFLDLLPALILMPVLTRQALLRSRKLVVVGVAVLMVVLGSWSVWSPTRPQTGAQVHHRFHLKTAQQVGVLGYHISSASGLIAEAWRGVAVTEDDWRFVVDVLEERRPQRAGTGEFFGVAAGFNLVMIQVESLQGQLLGLQIAGEEVTPTLNRLAEEGVSFTLGIDQTRWGRTSDAEVLSQTSLLPDRRGPSVFRHAGNDLVGLADILGEHGYSTLVAVPFRESFWNRRYSHPAFGFDTRLYDTDLEPGRMVGWGLNDRDFLEQMTGRLGDQPEPFFAYLITLSNHHPFAGFPRDFEILNLEEIDSAPIVGYLHSMRWADHAIGIFLDNLEELGLASKTVVVIFGDHRAGLNRVSDGSGVINFGFSKGERILNERVPVVLRIPGDLAPRGPRDIPIGLFDLPPTIAALLGIDPGGLPWLGRNLFGAPVDGPVPVGGRVWVDGRHVYSDAADACFDRVTAVRVKRSACDQGLVEANRLLAAGALILDGDLQQRLRAVLESAVEPGPRPHDDSSRDLE